MASPEVPVLLANTTAAVGSDANAGVNRSEPAALAGIDPSHRSSAAGFRGTGDGIAGSKLLQLATYATIDFWTKGSASMADSDNLKDTKEYFLDIPVKAAQSKVRGASALDWGMQPARAHFSPRSGKTVMLASITAIFRAPRPAWNALTSPLSRCCRTPMR
jgi:hypothetical protein